MIRLIGVWVFVSAILAVMTHWPVWIFSIPLAVLLLLAYSIGGLKTHCPSCGKGIKIGYGTCSYCNWSAQPK